MKRVPLISILFLSFFQIRANPTLPHIFGDNMVLQRNRSVPVWGWGDPGEKISVKMAGQVKQVKAGSNGKWSVSLDPMQAGGPFELVVEGKNTVKFSNVLVGEVWICSGQSNMEMPIEGWGKIDHYEEEIAAADYPQIRQIKVPNTVSSVPKEDIPSTDWKICNPSNAGNFTAAGYFFARQLFQALHVPIGLINTSWGGTHVETWTSRQGFENSDEFRGMISGMKEVNLDEIIKTRNESLAKKISDKEGAPFSSGRNTSAWMDPQFVETNWMHLQLPQVWEQQGLAGLDGVVWFRKTVEIPAQEAGKPFTLWLADVDDTDSTWVNGTLVGTATNCCVLRKYTVPAGLLKAGKNLVAVRVHDTGGDGGIYGEKNELKIMVGDQNYSLAGDWLAKVESIEAGGSRGVSPNAFPTLLFNAMVNPLIPYAFKGVIWYQGEANAGRAFQYRKAFPLMIADWRSHWHRGDFPFLFVQLSSFNAGNGDSRHGSTWAELREAQLQTLQSPATGMAVTTDIGNAKDIHPKNKQDVGKRLAAIALNNVYAQTQEFSGPMYKSMRVEGNKVILYFSHADHGFLAKNKYGYLEGFEIAGADREFRFAKAMIEGDHIVVFQDGVMAPVAVRYGWMDDAGEANLFNTEGFPASPFRTDQWKGITEGEKFSFGQ